MPNNSRGKIYKSLVGRYYLRLPQPIRDDSGSVPGLPIARRLAVAFVVEAWRL